jgi:ribose transport system substrate-binding protein
MMMILAKTKPTLALLAALALPSCKGSSSNSIAVVPKGSTHAFWKSVHAGVQRAASESGTRVIWKGPLREDDRQEQINLVESFIDMRVKGILLAPLDATALGRVATDAIRSKIPVVVFDSSQLEAKPVVSFVATDNVLAGRLAGQHLARSMGGKGRVILLRYAEGCASTAERESGFLEALAAHPGITLASANQFGGATVESAFKASENLLAAHRTEGGLSVQGIFTPNESTTFGMLRALQDNGLAGKVRFVGFDTSPQLVEAITKGELDAAVVQDPMEMGYRALKAMEDHLAGKPVQQRIDTTAALVTRENMNEPKLSALVRPDYDKWLR